MSILSPAPEALTRTLSRGGQKLWLPFDQSVAARSTSHSSRSQAELVSLAFTVCFVLFSMKAFLAYNVLNKADSPPRLWDDSFILSVGRIALCCAEDFAVGLGCLLAAGIALSLGSALWYRRSVRLFAHVAAVAALALIVIDAQLFQFMRRFLNVSLFQLAGGFKLERSVDDSITLAARLAVLLIPLLTLAAHLAGASFFARWWRYAASFICRPAVLVLLILAFSATAYSARQTEFSRLNPDFSQNPHLLLARSYFWNMRFGDLDDAEMDLADFLPGRPRPSVGLLDQHPKNIVLIVLESGGAGYFSSHGYPLATTPCLARLQDKGIVFDNFYATANHTIASALPLFGSTYNKLNSISTVVDHPEFPVPAASSWLQKHGYETCFLGSGGQHALEDYRNLAPAFLQQGFDIGRDPIHPFWQSCPDATAFQKREYLDDCMFSDARRYVRSAQGKKFFLMLWNYDTHFPFNDGGDTTNFDERHFPAAVRADAERKEDFTTFLHSLHRVDRLIGEFYSELERLGLADDTIVVVTGDHGESAGQHGWFFHGHSLYDEEVHVPLFLICPRLAHLGPRSATVGSHIDLWPTLTDICDLPAHPLWQGRSLLGGGPDDERRAYFFRKGHIGVREGKYKYIWDYEAQLDLLFDMEKDPGERANIAVNHADFCKRQRARLRDWTNYQEKFTQERLSAMQR
jgi:arylsulfatase A-like enzyme